MQSIDFLVSINLSRIRTIIQHPVHNLNPSGQILVPKRPEQVLSPVNARMRFDSPHKIIQSPVPNDPARSPRSLAHFPLPSFVYMRSVSHGVLHTIITRIPVTPQKLFRINFTRKILVPQLTIFCFRYVPHVPQTIPRITRTPLHLTPLTPVRIDMNVRPIRGITNRTNPHPPQPEPNSSNSPLPRLSQKQDAVTDHSPCNHTYADTTPDIVLQRARQTSATRSAHRTPYPRSHPNQSQDTRKSHHRTEQPRHPKQSSHQ